MRIIAPRAHLFTRPLATRLPLLATRTSTPRTRTLSSTASYRADLPFSQGPSPPRLPEEDQKIFEELQRQSTGAFSTPRSQQPSPQDPTDINQSPDASVSEAQEAKNLIAERLAKLRGKASTLSDGGNGEGQEVKTRRIDDKDDGETLHPNLRRGARPEFEGERNPKTGEVGGPKNEPLRWGSEGEWSYNGRTTDF